MPLIPAEASGIVPKSVILKCKSEILNISWAWWYPPLILALGRQSQADLCEIQPGLHNEFPAIRGYDEETMSQKQANKNKAPQI